MTVSLASVIRARPVVFYQPATVNTPNGSFVEEISATAFRALFAANGHHGTLLTREHDPKRLLARSPGSMQLTLAPGGIDAIADLIPSDLGRETAWLIARNDLNAMSFSFHAGMDEWFEDRKGGVRRVITVIDQLFDVSIVARPAYSGTTLAIGERSWLPTKIVEKYHATRNAHRQSLHRESLEWRSRARSIPRPARFVKLTKARSTRFSDLSIVETG